MKWTTEKPTAPGWYWYKGAGYPTILYVYTETFIGSLFVEDPDYGGPVQGYPGEWAGPIPEPEEV